MNAPKNKQTIHLIGIAGIGMSGIAKILLKQGYSVTGSDLKPNQLTQGLEELGATIHQGHHPKYIQNADVVVFSSAIPEENVERRAAQAKNILMMTRGQMLAELMQLKTGIAISGTHGKTTTTALIAHILTEAKLDPTAIIGAWFPDFRSNVRFGQGDYLIAEADESDCSFLKLRPNIAVITNINNDHLENYSDDFACLRQAFLDFVHHLPFYGMVVVCIDDRTVASIVRDIRHPILSYGFSASANFRAQKVKHHNMQSHFTVIRPSGQGDLTVTFNMMGEHNVLNALAAIAVASHLNIDDDIICRALSEFKGVERRLQVRGQLRLADSWTDSQAIDLIDDYGHHPDEISVALKSIKQQWPDRRLVLAFQPHRYSRLQRLLRDFASILSSTDKLLLLHVYPAGELMPSPNPFDKLCEVITPLMSHPPIIIDSVDTLSTTLAGILRPHDILLIQGAGDITEVCSKLLKYWGK